MNPTQWKDLDPSHRSSKKHRPLTHEETMVTVDACHPDTVAEVRKTCAEIGDAWKRMKDYW